MGDETVSLDELRFREATAADGERMKRLMETNPDGGDVAFAPRLKANPYEMYENMMPSSDQVSILAETPEGDAVGMGSMTFSEARIGGELGERAYLAGLVVDSAYRGMGIGKQLAAERVRYAEEQRGDDVVISAGIQNGNDASMQVARSWAEGFPYEFVNQPVEMRDTTPDTVYDFQTLDSSSVPEFVTAINEFYSEAELYSPYQEDNLDELLDVSVDGKYVHRCDMVSEGGDIVAGAHVLDSYKLMSMVVEELPAELAEADELPPSIPEDGEIRPRIVVPWFKQGYEDAGNDLIEQERARAGDANRLMFLYDPDGPLSKLDALNVDEGTMRMNWALRGLDEQKEDAFVAPGLA